MAIQLTDEQKALKKGDQVVIGSQLDSQQDLMYRNYFGEIIDICGEFAFVDSDKVGLSQSVSFRAWLPIRTLTRTA